MTVRQEKISTEEENYLSCKWITSGLKTKLFPYIMWKHVPFISNSVLIQLMIQWQSVNKDSCSLLVYLCLNMSSTTDGLFNFVNLIEFSKSRLLYFFVLISMYISTVAWVWVYILISCILMNISTLYRISREQSAAYIENSWPKRKEVSFCTFTNYLLLYDMMTLDLHSSWFICIHNSSHHRTFLTVSKYFSFLN